MFRLLVVLFVAWVGIVEAGTISCTQVELTGAADTVSVGGLLRQYVTLKAHDDNTDKIYCGADTPTSTTGFELGAGDGITFGADNVPLDQDLTLSCIVGSGTQRVSKCEHYK